MLIAVGASDGGEVDDVGAGGVGVVADGVDDFGGFFEALFDG